MGTKILGLPIGSESFVSSTCMKIEESGNVLCNELALLSDPQSALLLL